MMVRTSMAAYLIVPSLGWLFAPVSASQSSLRSAQQPAPPLHDRVRAAGAHLDEALEMGDVASADLSELASRSPLIVIGPVLASRSRLAPDERNVATEVALLVRECPKGAVAPGSLLYIRAPGGTHRFADGRTARQTVAGFRMIRSASVYVLFLRPTPLPVHNLETMPSPAGAELYRARHELAVGPQGIFELDFASGVVIPAASRSDHPLAARYRNTAITGFLSELHRAVPR
jgi:hypothetical protein